MNKPDREHPEQNEEEKPPLKPDFLDAVALFIATLQILAPAMLVIIGTLVVAYLFLLLLAR
ncbi:MAG: hypothetical protein AB1445_08985 [Bacillota bacterium]